MHHRLWCHQDPIIIKGGKNKTDTEVRSPWWFSFIQYKHSFDLPVIAFCVCLSFLAVWVVHGSCEPGPGWRCNASGLDCTSPPPPAASSAEPLRNLQPCRSSAVLTQRTGRTGKITWLKSEDINMTFQHHSTQKIAICKFRIIYQVQVLLADSGQTEATPSTSLQPT